MIMHAFLAGVTGVVVLFAWCGCASRPVRTIENVKNTIENDQRVARQYAAFSRQADDEELRNISNLLEAMALCEEIQMRRLQRILDRYDIAYAAAESDDSLRMASTVENLGVSVQVERFLSRTAFPIFVESAHAERAYHARTCFEQARQIAHRHADYCYRAMESLTRDSSDRNVVNSWSVCPQCGCLYPTAVLPAVCEICGEEGCRFDLFQ